MRTVHITLFLCACLSPARALPPQTRPGPGPSVQAIQTSAKRAAELDTAKVRALYMDGDFEEAIVLLEKARKANQIKTHADSVFVYKHLGVMYAAKYETMEKGKLFMFQLLTIEPTVRIMDMYASDMIYMVFRNVQAEYEIRHARPKDTLLVQQNPIDTGKGTPKPRVVKARSWPYWTAGAVALVAGAGLAAYFILDEKPSEPKKYEGDL